MTQWDDPSVRSSDIRLEERVIRALSTFPGQVAFNGLRRTLGVHPESLSRALRRLERDGTVERTQNGYRLLGDGLRRTSSRGARPPSLVAEVRLSPGFSPRQILKEMSGRWFGSLRWVGLDDRSGDLRMVWAPRDGQGGWISLEIKDDRLRVLREPVDDPAAHPQVLDAAAYELLRHVLERLKSGGERGGVLSGSDFTPPDPTVN
jgi:hypothetical protein